MCNRASAKVLSVVGILLLCRHARAEGNRTSSLAWVRLDGADSCIAGPALARAVEQRLGRKVFVSPGDADITVEGAIRPRSPSGYQATLRVTTKDGTVLGTRDVETRSMRCDAIDTKLALVVSVLIDPDAPEPEPPAPVAAPALDPPTVIERERVVVIREKPTAAERQWHVELGLGGMGSLGLQPGVGFGLTPSVALLPPTFFALIVSGGMSAPTDIAAERSATVEASFAHGSISFCPLVVERKFLRALVCGGAMFGSLQSRGIGFDTSRTTSSLAAGPQVGGRASVPILGPLVAIVGATLVVPVARAELGYRTASGESTVFRTAVIAGAAELALGVRLP